MKDFEQQIQTVKAFLLTLQANICSTLEQQEKAGGGTATFIADDWLRDPKGTDSLGGGRSCVITGGTVIEKGGVMFSHIHIDKLPATATERHPELAGRQAQALGVSLVIHPTNPHVPTSHANVRLFVAEKDNSEPIWWFGGGFDLTPFYPVMQDCVDWHAHCQQICQPFGQGVYSKFKKWCDEYFYLAHREEQRGIGGLFFDDINNKTMGADWDFNTCFNFMQAVGNGYLQAVVPLFEKHKNDAYTQQQRDFQLYRRGRYVEFNLVYDRGTLFGLQSKGRIESILVSMPPLASWEYRFEPEKGSSEFELTDCYLKPRDWLAIE